MSTNMSRITHFYSLPWIQILELYFSRIARTLFSEWIFPKRTKSLIRGSISVGIFNVSFSPLYYLYSKNIQIEISISPSIIQLSGSQRLFLNLMSLKFRLVFFFFFLLTALTRETLCINFLKLFHKLAHKSFDQNFSTQDKLPINIDKSFKIPNP